MFLFSSPRGFDVRGFAADEARAFTLLEILLVIALVAVLGGLVLGGGRYVAAAGRTARTRAELAAWTAALEDYRAIHGDYPRSLAALTGGASVWLDPWDRPYRFAYKTQVPWSNPGYVLYSAGPDGAASEALRTGGFADLAATENADNLYADRP